MIYLRLSFSVMDESEDEKYENYLRNLGWL